MTNEKKMITVKVGSKAVIDSKYRRITYINDYKSKLNLEDKSLDDSIEILQKIQVEFSKEYTFLHIRFEEYDCSCYYSCNCGKKYFVYGTRLETDEEFNARILFEAETAKEREKADREAYNLLKKKFG